MFLQALPWFSSSGRTRLFDGGYFLSAAYSGFAYNDYSGRLSETRTLIARIPSGRSNSIWHRNRILLYGMWVVVVFKPNYVPSFLHVSWNTLSRAREISLTFYAPHSNCSRTILSGVVFGAVFTISSGEYSGTPRAGEAETPQRTPPPIMYNVGTVTVLRYKDVFASGL